MLFRSQSGDAVLSTTRFQKVCHALPGVVPPRLSSPLSRSHCEREPSGEVGSRGRRQSCWFAVAAMTCAVTAFPPPIETSAVSHSASRVAHATVGRFLIAASRRLPCSQVPAVLRPLPSEPVSDALARAREGSWPREPGTPTAPDCSPVARSYRGVTRARLAPRSFTLVLSKNCAQNA